MGSHPGKWEIVDCIDPINGPFPSKPDAILSLVAQAQESLGDEIDLRYLMWEVINDVSSSYEHALLPLIGQNLTSDVNNTIGDYLANHYGDD